MTTGIRLCLQTHSSRFAVELELLQEFLYIPVESPWSVGTQNESHIHRLPATVSFDHTIYLVLAT